jgi:hypothetical protein
VPRLDHSLHIYSYILLFCAIILRIFIIVKICSFVIIFLLKSIDQMQTSSTKEILDRQREYQNASIKELINIIILLKKMV